MFSSKLDDESVNVLVSVIILTSRKEFTECAQQRGHSIECREASQAAFDLLHESRDSVTFGFDSANKKAAKKAAQATLYEVNRAIAVKEYALARRKLSEGVREVLLVSVTDLGRKIFADKMDVFLNSPTLSNAIHDESNESYESSVLMLNACVFALKRELKNIGVFKGPIKD